MSKIGYIQRYLFIIRYVRSHEYCSLNDILTFVKEQLDIHDINEVGLSEKTLRRDFIEISRLGLSIVYKSKRGYYIPKDENRHSDIEDILDSFVILNSIGGDNGIPDYIIPEKRSSRGTEHFLTLKKAIEQNNIVQFTYKKFYPEDSEIRKIKPYALKQSRGRWYILGFDNEANGIAKSFGLDRIQLLEILNQKFKKDETIDWNKKYEYCFAMFTDDTSPQKIVLSFDNRDGNYIEAMPIHKSQKITRKGKQVFVELYLQITLDFIMEIMSRSWSLEVVEPLTLRNQLRNIYTEATIRNQ